MRPVNHSYSSSGTGVTNHVAAIAFTAVLALAPTAHAERMRTGAGVDAASATGVATESFWVDRTPHPAHVTKTTKPAQSASTPAKRVTAAAAKKPVEVPPLASAPLGLDSIAGQLSANQSVPWSIVIGLTLLTLLPALLLSMTPWCGCWWSFTFCARRWERRPRPRTRS